MIPNIQKYILVCISAAIFITGCGGGTQTPEDQVREVMIKSLEAATSDNPSTMCVYTTEPGECLQGMVMAKTLGMDLSEMMQAALPKDWRNQIKQAKITINGNKATMSSLVKGEKPDEFVKQNGKWLSVS